MQKAGFQNGMAINSIGFTNGVAQSDTTKGRFKVYLQNTTDIKSRLDTNWTVVTTSSNSLHLTGLVKGSYEWQVMTCGGSSFDTAKSIFANNNLSACNPPTNFTTDNITTTSATFHWVAPASPGIIKYVVQYSLADTIEVWVTDTVTTTSKTVTGLLAGKKYQWRVKTICASSSDFANTSFSTEPIAAGCNNPTGLSTGSITGNSVILSWTGAVGATYYNILYRRVGSASWSSQLAFSISNSVTGLQQGTTYEWKARTVCVLGNGAYVSGTNFTTTGTTTCYAPYGLSADSLTDSTAILTWVANGSASYKIRYRLKEFINWTDVATMTQVHNDSIIIPKTIGSYDIPFVNGTAFTYTGGGLYVAYEYARPTGALPLIPNTALCTRGDSIIKGSFGQDSLRYVLSLGANKQDTLPGILPSVNYRPETRFGSPGIKDSVEVATVYALGYNAIPFGNPTPVSALIKNHSDTSHNYNVTLVIKDQATNAVRYGPVVQSVFVNKHAANTVSFPAWSPSLSEKDSVIVSIDPQTNENFVVNNRNYYLQNNNRYQIGYVDSSKALTQTGFDTLSGLILTRYFMHGCGRINAVQVYLGNSAKGHSVYAVAVDTAETIIAVSNPFTPDSSQVNRYHTFYFASSPLLKDVDYYVGLGQTATSAGNGYFPVGVQWEGGTARSNAYYKAKLNGDSITGYADIGRLMIKAELVPDTLAPFISGNLFLCANTSNTLTASSINRRYADSLIAFSTQVSPNVYSANTVLGTPDVYPNYGISANAWASSTPDGRREYLTLRFPHPAPVNVVEIYETLNPGAVDSIFVKNPGTGNYDLVYSTTAKAASQSARLNRISFPTTAYNVSEIRIAIASNSIAGNNCIDAVAIGKLTTPGSFSSYLWTPGGETTQTKIVTVAGGYKLTVTNAAGCSASDSVTVVTPVLTAPVITASGPITFCTGDSVRLISSKHGGNTWSTGATTDSIVVKVNGSYSVTHNDGSGCGTTTSASVTVTVNALPVASISGQLGICPGGNTTLTAAPSGNTYLWSNGVTTITNIISSAGSISVLVTNANGCRASAQATTFLVTAATPHITGTFSFCPGGSATLNAGAGFTSYLWSSGQTTASITVSTPGNYSVTVTNSFGCSGSDNKTVIQNTPPSPFIAGGLSLCAGPTTLNAGGGYSAYLWSTSETTQTINVNSAGTFSVTVTDINGCTGSASVTTATDSLPATPGPISGPATGVCNSPGAAFSISPVPNTTHYVWFVPPGASIVSGQGTTAVVIAFDGTFASGDLIVASSNACGQSGSLVPTILPLKAIPANPTAINGAVSGLCGISGMVYSTPAVSLATSYTWTASPGITITAGQGSAFITVNFSNTFVSGNICVTANNSCGSSGQRCITVTGPPATPATISGPTAICFRQSNVLYSVPAVSGALTYTWTVPEQASIASGQGTNSIRINFGNKSGNVTVIATNVCGSSTQQSLVVVVSNCIVKNSSNGEGTSSAEQRFEPEVIANDGGNNKLGDMQVEWTLGEPAIESVANNDRLYTQGFHQPLIVMSRKNEEIVIEDDMKITAAPNPVEHILTVSFWSKKDESLMINLVDVNGKILFVKPINGKTGTMQINMSAYSDGMYLLNVRRIQGGFSRNIKVIKVN